MKRALFIVSTAGQGHIVRCRALAAELVSRGWGCTMTSHAPLSANSYDVAIVDHHDYGFRGAALLAVSDRPAVAIIDDTDAVARANLVVMGSAYVADAVEYAGAVQDLFGRRPLCLFGPRYSLLRPEFREARASGASMPQEVTTAPTLDLRAFNGLTAGQVADLLLKSKADGAPIVTYGGMRAMEAACVRHGSWGMTIELSNEGNEGEELNRRALLADPHADLVDGLGCVRVADAITELCG